MTETYAPSYFLVVHRGASGDSGLYYTCGKAIGDPHQSRPSWCARTPMYRSTNAGPSLALFNNTITCVYVDTDGYLKSTTWPQNATNWTADTYVQDSIGQRSRSSDRTPALFVSADGTTLFLVYVGWGTNQLYWCTSTDGTTWTLGYQVSNCTSEAGVAGVSYNGGTHIVFPSDVYTDELLTACYTGSGWLDASHLSDSNPPKSCSTPALLYWGIWLNLAHRGQSGNESIWFGVLTPSGPEGTLRLFRPELQSGNQSADGPALVVSGYGYCLHRSWGNEDAADLYCSIFDGNTVGQDWQVPNNQLFFEPAALGIDNSLYGVCAC